MTAPAHHCGHPVAILHDAIRDELYAHWPRPMPQTQYDDFPVDISEAAKDAHTCLSVGPFRAAATMARMTVEAIAKDKHVRGSNLATKIDGLRTADLIRFAGTSS
ncbi:DUF4145 domain-containing protein [Microtetraspora malaysiensis]|uniref:DUF4145 domain-containing protein n=1 Tax=Microtetraspora malaysiensis TaxID=161358 RepID=UPI003D8A2495